MAGKFVMANDVKAGTKIWLKDGTPATVLDNGRGMSRRIETPSVFGQGTDQGGEYIFRWSCLEDGTPIRLSDTQQKRARLIQLSGF